VTAGGRKTERGGEIFFRKRVVEEKVDQKNHGINPVSGIPGYSWVFLVFLGQ